MRLNLKISGMSCAACSASIERSLSRKDFIEKIEVDLINERAFCVFDEQKSSAENIVKLIEKLGYGAEIVGDSRESRESDSRDSRESDSQDSRDLKDSRDFLLAIIFAIPLFGISMGAMFLDFLHARFTLILEIFLLLPILYAGRKIYAKGARALISCVPNMDSLVFLGSFSAIVYSAFVILARGALDSHLLHEVYFESAGVIIAVIMLGKKLESLATRGAKGGIESLLKLAPKNAIKLESSGKSREVSIDSLQIGDEILVKKGASFPLDCVLLSELAEIDTSAISGESAPKRAQNGDLILSGCINKGEEVRVRAAKLAKDSTISQIIALIQDVKKAKIARAADKISGIFVPCVIFLALISGVFWYFYADFTRAFIAFSATLLISCPCALGLATPLSVLIATNRAARRAFYYKNAESLEAAAKISCMIFDKTGTLTSGDLKVEKFVLARDLGDLSESEILGAIFALEAKSEHLIARAICEFTREKAARFEASEVQTHAGKGISGVVNGKKIKIGTADFVGDSFEIAQGAAINCFVSVENACVGGFVIKDNVRENARGVVESLREMGVRSVILSGDNAHEVAKVARACEIQEFHAAQLPQDKLFFIESLQKNGVCVGFVGDGINDALAIKRANLGIALKNSTDIAIKQSDVILLNDDLRGICEALRLSRATLKNIKENLAFAFIYNACAIPLAVGIPQLLDAKIALNPMIASIAMGLSSLSVVLNAMRLWRVRI